MTWLPTLSTWLACLAADGTPVATGQDPAAAEAFFESRIRPVLAESCLGCHGEKKARGALRLDSRHALLKGGNTGPAVVLGKPEDSLLIQAVRHSHEEIKMPPDRRLPDRVVQDFADWVKAGAVWPGAKPERAAGRHWAFEPIGRPQPPTDPEAKPDNPVDLFLRAGLRKRGLSPAAEADARTLIRRVTFDLTGLPPTPAEVEAFAADKSPDAWPRLVDRLLASPQYGERWARHWLDVVRYADSAGFESDELYPSAWQYRDYVIRALNADKPLDRFIREQVAGDELYPGDPVAAGATALYCIGPAMEESAMTPMQLESEWLTDAVDTTGAAFLGLTVGCARCHDHKYDPISQKDYYALQAMFAADDRPYSAKVRTLRIKALNGLLAEAALPDALKNDPRCTLRSEDKTGFRLFRRDQPLEIRRLHRGELSKPREAVAPAVPAGIAAAAPGSAAAETCARRSALAAWLTAPENPLTARVLVNRVWGWHFGTGIVRTANDFGRQGEPPSHPALLDWLARDLMDHGWSLKHVHRRILLSDAYRMSSVSDGGGAEADPENRLLRHFPRRRLDAEEIRDALLACAGTLNPKMFGPAVVPPLDGQELAGLFDARGKWPVGKDPAEHTRRSVYLLVRRTFTFPAFAAFDAPEVMSSTAGRTRTVTPAQALTLLNSPLARGQSAAFADRLIRECGDDPAKVVECAWRIAFARPPTASERGTAAAFVKSRTPAGGSPQAAVAELCLALFNSNEFLNVD